MQLEAAAKSAPAHLSFRVYQQSSVPALCWSLWPLTLSIWLSAWFSLRLSLSLSLCAEKSWSWPSCALFSASLSQLSDSVSIYVHTTKEIQKCIMLVLNLVQKRELGGQWKTDILFELWIWSVLQYWYFPTNAMIPFRVWGVGICLIYPHSLLLFYKVSNRCCKCFEPVSSTLMFYSLSFIIPIWFQWLKMQWRGLYLSLTIWSTKQAFLTQSREVPRTTLH